jgi:hypothetical protein
LSTASGTARQFTDALPPTITGVSGKPHEARPISP